MTARMAIGTSGWSYPSGYGKWKGVFYPKRWDGDELAYYADRLPAVEVNASFYRLPSAETVRGWAERTPAHFLFAMKLFRKFTHPAFYAREEGKSPEITEADVRAMRQALDPLMERGKLGALLVQYADLFTCTPAHLSALTRTLDAFRDYPLAVELRHASWDGAQTREVLGFFRAARVRIDEPLYQNLAEPGVPGIDREYWRFHGRNTAAWQTAGAGHARYDYLYSDDELDVLADLVERNVRPDGHALVFFNNHPAGKALVNAVQLASKLSLPLPYQKFAHLGVHYPALASITGGVGGQLGLL